MREPIEVRLVVVRVCSSRLLIKEGLDACLEGEFKDNSLCQKDKIESNHHSSQDFCQLPSLAVNGRNHQQKHAQEYEDGDPNVSPINLYIKKGQDNVSAGCWQNKWKKRNMYSFIKPLSTYMNSVWPVGEGHEDQPRDG